MARCRICKHTEPDKQMATSEVCSSCWSVRPAPNLRPEGSVAEPGRNPVMTLRAWQERGKALRPDSYCQTCGQKRTKKQMFSETRCFSCWWDNLTKKG